MIRYKESTCEVMTSDSVCRKLGRTDSSSYRISSQINFDNFSAMGLWKLQCKSTGFLVFRIVEIFHGCEV